MSWFEVTYRVRARADEIDAAARAIALEQSVELPLEAVHDADVRERIVGRIAAVRPLAEGVYDVRIRLAVATTGLDPAQTINMLFGNSSLHDTVELIDADLGPEFAQAFGGGPRFGIAGLRERLGVHDRALTCSALKPQGLSSARLAALAETFARGGIDVIKDDHGIADQAYSPFAERARACQRAVDRVNRETGARTLYAPSLVGGPRVLYERARIVREEGIGMALIAPALIGMPVFRELVAEHLEGVAILAHPAYAGAARVDPPFLLGRLFRLFGADAVIYPHYGGRFAYSPERCRAIADAARGAWLGIAPQLPTPAGGMSVEGVPDVLKFYGRDAMLLIGGSLLKAGDRLLERTRDFASRVAAGGAA